MKTSSILSLKGISKVGVQSFRQFKLYKCVFVLLLFYKKLLSCAQTNLQPPIRADDNIHAKSIMCTNTYVIMWFICMCLCVCAYMCLYMCNNVKIIIVAKLNHLCDDNLLQAHNRFRQHCN
jgi:hypothetical protein